MKKMSQLSINTNSSKYVLQHVHTTPKQLREPANPKEVRPGSQFPNSITISHTYPPLYTELPASILARPTEREGVSDQYQVRDKCMERN